MQYVRSFLYQNLTDAMLYTLFRSIWSQASLILQRSSVCEQWFISWLKFLSTARDASKVSYVVLLVATVNPFWTSWSIKIKKFWTEKCKLKTHFYADLSIKIKIHTILFFKTILTNCFCLNSKWYLVNFTLYMCFLKKNRHKQCIICYRFEKIPLLLGFIKSILDNNVLSMTLN